MLHLVEQLNIKYPIIQGGMGNISNAILTAAVSEAGGLGTIGCGTMTPDQVEEMIQETKRRTDKPFAVNIPITVTPFLEDIINVVIDNHIPVVSLSAGNPASIIPKLHSYGIKIIVVVASVKHAKKAEGAGADLLVAEGFEAAGINSNLELTTFTLIPQLSQCVNIPVIAAGGIGDGKGLAAALMLGASGVQIGTRLIATQEAPFHMSYKQKLIQASDTDTVVVGRSVGQVRRILNTPYANRIVKKENEGMILEDYNKMTSENLHVIGALKGDFVNGFINSGQVAGLLSNIPSVKELLENMMEEASSQIQQSFSVFETFTS
jgi:enoyl-[acyl-carrier protein] reductase II